MERPTLHVGHLVVVTSFMANCIASGMGYANSAYYYSYWLEAFGQESWLTSMVGSLNIAAVCLVGPLSGAMINILGYRLTVFFGSFLSLLGLIVCSFASSIYVLLVFYCLTGAGWGFTFIPLSLAFTHYFQPRYHGICLSIIFCGSGFGHFITPPIVDALTRTYGWKGAMLVQAGLSAQTFILGASIMKTDSMKETVRSTSSSWKLSLFKNSDFLFLLAHTLLITTGLSVIFVHISYSIETFTNVDAGQSALAVSVFGLAALVGKFSHGVICKLHGVNAILQTMISVILGGISTCLIPFVTTFWIDIVICIVIGFSSGPYGPVVVLITLQTVRNDEAPSAYGYVNLFGGIGFCMGAPIAGALYDRTRNYVASMIFGGSVFICSGLILTKTAIKWQKRIMNKKNWGEELCLEEHKTPEEEKASISPRRKEEVESASFISPQPEEESSISPKSEEESFLTRKLSIK